MNKYIKYLVEEMHTSIMATNDEEGHPVTCAIDLMDYDDNGIYFLTAKGKKFYERLISNKYLALTALKGEDTLSSKALSLTGKVEEVGPSRLERLFLKNTYMNDIYPSVESRKALTVFRIYDAKCEWFDLSQLPIERESFVFGNAELEQNGFFVEDTCIGCSKCIKECPQSCIEMKDGKAAINQNHCLHCGICKEVCPNQSIIRK